MNLYSSLILLLKLLISRQQETSIETFSYIKIQMDDIAIRLCTTMERCRSIYINLQMNETTIDMYNKERESEAIIHINDDTHLDNNMSMKISSFELDPIQKVIYFPLQFKDKDYTRIGFGHHFIDYNYSIVHQLYKKLLQIHENQ